MSSNAKDGEQLTIQFILYKEPTFPILAAIFVKLILNPLVRYTPYFYTYKALDEIKKY
uniref:Uncharacterized protein n=1 Tax=Heterorhabditis bacteriophora TaxID=37862 RepID=A0A1I7WQV8_HETBA